MDNYTEIKNKIRAMVGQKTPLLLTGKVKSVDGETCTVSIGDLTLTDVRLRSVINGEDSKLLITPATDSYVTIIDLSGELRETEVIGYSQIKAIDIQGTDADPVKVTINGGDNKGLVKIEKLTEQLNKLVEKFNAHTHQVQVPVATTQSGQVASGPTMVPSSQISVPYFYERQYEDTNVTH